MSAEPRTARLCLCERPLLDSETCLRCGRPPTLVKDPGLFGQPARRRAAWSRSGVLRALRAFAFFRGRAPVHADWKQRMDGCPSLETVESLFGSLEAAARAAGIGPRRSQTARD
jgi:hypothetical protein